MGLNAILLVAVSDPPTSLVSIRENFLNQFFLTIDDFYSEGPFILISNNYLDIDFKNAAKKYIYSVNFIVSYSWIGGSKVEINFFVQCANWIEENFFACDIYYGNDCSDTSFVVFDKISRENFLRSCTRP